MKKINLLIVLLVAFSMPDFAQTYKIDTSNISYENKLRPCWDVTYDAEAKTVKKAWSSFLKKNYKIKTKGIGFLTDKDIVYSEDVTIHSIADKRMNMYVRVTDRPGGSDMKYFMSFGYDFFIGPENYPSEFAGMKKLLNDFSMKFLNEYYADETSRIMKEIKKAEKDIKSNDRSVRKNSRKSTKVSSAEATGLESKNNTLNIETKGIYERINKLKDDLNKIKSKQNGLVRSE
jgi:hypothetical protein